MNFADQSAFFASLIASDPEIARLVSETYKIEGRPAAIAVTRTANVASAPLMGRGIRAGKMRASGGPGSRGGKVKVKAEKAPERPICALTLRDDGPRAAHFMSAILSAGRRPRMHEVDGADPVTGECWFAGDPKLGSNGEPIFYYDPALVRPDERAAMQACFDGWSAGEAHGSMLDQARILAQIAVRREGTPVVERAFHYRGIDGKPKTVINTVSLPPVVALPYGYRSAESHGARWSADGYVAGLPRPIQKLLADLAARERLAANEVVTLGKLREFASEGDRDSYEALMGKEYPSEKKMEPIYSTDGITVESYTTVEVPHPVVQALKREHGQSLIDRLAKLEAFAGARLGEIQKDLDGLASGETSPETVERVYAAMLARGSVVTLEEALMTCYDAGSRQYYSLPVGTTFDAAPIERAAARREEEELYLRK